MLHSIIDFFQNFWFVFAIIAFSAFLNLLITYIELEHSKGDSSNE